MIPDEAVSNRVESAAKAILATEAGHAPSLTWEVTSDGLRRDYTTSAKAALAAADAVMFSEDAVDNVARTLFLANNSYLDTWERYPEGSLIKDKFRTQARAVIAALKGNAR